MNVKQIVGLSVGLVVGIIMVSGLIIPIVQGASEVHEYNNYGNIASVKQGTDTTTIEWVWDGQIGGEYSWIVNGVEQTQFIKSASSRAYLYISDNMQLSIVTDNEGVIQNTGLGFDWNQNGVRSVRYNTTHMILTITESATTVNILSATQGTPAEYTIPHTWAYYGADGGDYRIIYGPRDAGTYYYNSPEDIHGSNFVNAYSNKWFSFHGKEVEYQGETIEANIDSTVRGENVESFTFKNQSGWKSGYSFDISVSGADYTVYPYVYVMPNKIDGQPIGVTPADAALFGVIPLLAIVLLVLAAAGNIVVKRR